MQQMSGGSAESRMLSIRLPLHQIKKTEGERGIKLKAVRDSVSVHVPALVGKQLLLRLVRDKAGGGERQVRQVVELNEEGKAIG